MVAALSNQQGAVFDAVNEAMLAIDAARPPAA
jgi:hypothetical protein